MTAFVTGVGGRIGASSSTFTAKSEVCSRGATTRPTCAPTTTMRILDGLDTVTTQPYTFSRYILGPFQGITLSPNSGEQEREDAMAACYRHVFGNAYIMDEERAELAVAESQFKLGALTVREFVRALAKSYAYRSRFFESSNQYRFIELNFMHLLGRAPDTFEEMRTHNAICMGQGYDAEIDSYLDSFEYDSVFGEDTVPFLRFRGAYTPCDSFNKQCALKGGWANSDKAMGGAALSGYNGSDGRQMSTIISSHITDQTVPYEAVAVNTPLKTTAPNWYAAPDPAVAPTPAFVSSAEVRALQDQVAALQAQYNQELARKNSPGGKNQLEPFRAMTRELAPVLDRGFAYSGGDATLANPYAKLLDEEGDSLLSERGTKASDYKRYATNLENDTLSRIERDLENAKADLRVLEKALAQSTPVTPELLLPGQVAAKGVSLSDFQTVSRPRLSKSAVALAAATAAAAAVEEKEEEPMKVLGITLPKMPEMPKMPDVKSLLPK